METEENIERVIFNLINNLLNPYNKEHIIGVDKILKIDLLKEKIFPIEYDSEIIRKIIKFLKNCLFYDIHEKHLKKDELSKVFIEINKIDDKNFSLKVIVSYNDQKYIKKSRYLKI